MPEEDAIDPAVSEVIRRAGERPGPTPDEVANVELLAHVAEGTVTFDQVAEDDLGRLIDAYGVEHVADAFVRAGRSTAEPATRSQAWWARRWPVGLAASVALAGALWLLLGRPHSTSRSNPPGELALNWSPRDSAADADGAPWARAAARSQLGAAPDYENHRGATPDPSEIDAGANGEVVRGMEGPVPIHDPRAVRQREATAIILFDGGFGSGVVVDPRGYVLTNYHVVALAAQAAAAGGNVASVSVVLPHVVDGLLVPGPAVSARLYRADPEHDLALLKLDAFPAGEPSPPAYLRLADGVEVGQSCTLIGSEPGGRAWWARSGRVQAEFDYPGGPLGADQLVDRVRVAALRTDIRTTAGDFGGPVLNAGGELIGLTFAAPAALSNGPVAWQVALPALRAFLTPLPDRPEGVPFDLWDAGLPDATLLAPEVRGTSPDAIVYRYVQAPPHDAHPAAVAEAIYLTSGRPGDRPTTEATDAIIPAGLWGMGGRGSFRFELCILRRSDGLVAVGYVDPQGHLSEIRIGSGDQSLARVVWQRGADGGWQAVAHPVDRPLLDVAAIHAADPDRMADLLRRTFAHKS
jgi:S1-C subfamily serine protease